VQDQSDFATATLLGGDLSFEARLLSPADGELDIATPLRMPRGAAIKLETGDALILCEVIEASTEPDGFRARLKIRHVLKSMSDLEKLNRAILGHERPAREAEPAIAHRGRTERS
jgi:hypothetical protein